MNRNLRAKSSVFMIFKLHLNYLVSFSVLIVITIIFKIWYECYIHTLSLVIWNQTYEEKMDIRKVIYERKEKWILLKSDGMVTEWHWLVTKWSLKCTCNGDWKVTEWRLSVFTEWWNFVSCIVSCFYILIRVMYTLPLFKFVLFNNMFIYVYVCVTLI